MRLLNNATKAEIGQAFIFTGGQAIVFCWGGFGNAVVKLRFSPDLSNWFDLEGYTFIEATCPKTLHLPEGWLRGEIEGGDGETNVHLLVKKLPK